MKKALHGEVIFREYKIPKNSNRVKVSSDYYIVGESETHGNDHRVKVMEGVELYEKAGVLYIKNDVDTEIFCPNVDRHDTKVLPAGEWEIGHAKEFNYLNNRERIVRD